MDDLRRRIELALRRACEPDKHPSIELGVEEGRVGGRVLSSRFEGLAQVEREDLIRRQLDEALTLADRARIAFIVTETPEECEAMRREWAERWNTAN